MSTVKQSHIIPKCILHRHATKSREQGEAHFAWIHNTKTHHEQYISIESQCAKRYVYELRDENGCIVDGTKNLIEKKFSKLETEVASILQKCQKQNGLTENERFLLAVFTTLQILRTPETIQMNTEWYAKNAPRYTAAQHQRMALLSSLCALPDKNQSWIFYTTLNWVCAKQIVIWTAPFGNYFILNKQRPVCVLTPTKLSEPQYQTIIFPISSTQCLAFVCDNGIELPLYQTASSEYVDFINAYNYHNNTDYVYCKYIVSSLPFYSKLNRRTQTTEFTP